jgi:hypothetical protein
MRRQELGECWVWCWLGKGREGLICVSCSSGAKTYLQTLAEKILLRVFKVKYGKKNNL